MEQPCVDSSKWYEDFFTGLALEGWRRANSPEVTEEEAAFLLDRLDPPPGGRLLDAPCGHGRLALALARRGYAVHGVDQCAPYITEAQATAQAEDLPASFRRGDMRDPPQGAGQDSLSGAFDGAYCMGNSFGGLDAAGSGEFLRVVGDALRPGALFVLDSEVLAETLLPHLEHRVWMTLGDMMVLTEHQYHPLEGRLDSTYTFIQGTRRESAQAHHWIFSIAQVRAMLSAAGMQVLELLAGPEGAPYSLGDPRVLIVAQRVEVSGR